MIKKLILFSSFLISLCSLNAQWTTFGDKYAEDISCGADDQMVIGGRNTSGQNTYEVIYKYNFVTNSYQQISNVPITSYSSYRPSVNSAGIVWWLRNNVNHTENPRTVMYPSLVASDPIQGATWVSSINTSSAYVTTNQTNDGVFKYFSNGSIESVITGFNVLKAVSLVDDLYAIRQTPVQGNNVIRRLSNGTWVDLSTTPLIATDIAVGDADKILVVADGKLFFLYNGTWYRDHTAPANVQKVTIASTGKAFLTTQSTFPDVNVYTSTWAQITACASTVSAPVNTTPAENLTVCLPSSVELTASASGDVKWYSTFTDDNLLHTGSTFNTETINGYTTYYVENEDGACISNRIMIKANGKKIIHQYPFNDGNGTDVVGGYHAQKNGTWANTTDRHGNSDDALENTLNNSSNLSIPGISLEEMSVSMWVNRTSGQATGTTVLMSPNFTSGGPTHLEIRNSDNMLGMSNGVFVEFGVTIPADNTWRHIVWTSNGTNNTIYVDGTQVYTTTTGINTLLNPVARFANRFPSYTQALVGKIDDIEFFSNALTLNEARFIRGFEPNSSTTHNVCSGGITLDAPALLSAGDVTGTITYQWFKDGVAVAGATNTDLSLTTSEDNGVYHVEAYLECFKIKSSTYTVTVSGVEITNQPSDATICESTNHTLSVTANGNALSYQWYKGGVEITGATSSAYTINNISSSDAGTYEVNVYGVCDTVISTTVALTVTPVDFTITNQPVGGSVCGGGSFNLSVDVTGTVNSYQWYLNGSPVAGETASTLNIPVSSSNSGLYHVEFTSGSGCVVSSDTVLVEYIQSQLHHYPLDNGSGVDVIGSNDATITGWVNSGTDRNGNSNSVLANSNISGNGNVIDIADVSENEISVSMWISRSPSAGAYTTLMASDVNSGSGVHLLIRNSDNMLGMWNNGFVSFGTEIPVNNMWRHIVWTANGTNNTIYVDGVQVHNTASGINLTTFPVSRFGNNSPTTSGQGLVGKIDDIEIFPSVLTLNEVRFINGFVENPSTTHNLCSGGITLDAPALLFAGDVTGTITYQWFKDGVAIAGATNTNLSLTNLSDVGTYHVEAYLGCLSVKSSTHTVNVIDAVATATSVSTASTEDISGATYQWVDCDNGNAPVSGAVNPTFTATVTGNYAVIVTLGSCSETSNCVSLGSVGIEAIGQNNFIQLFPNPASEFCVLTNVPLHAEVKLLNTLGQVVKVINADTTTLNVDLNNLTDGIYYFSIRMDNEQISLQKLVVTK